MKQDRETQGVKKKANADYIQNDEFFRNSLAEREMARDFLQNYLPADISAHINFNTLKISKDSFVSKRMSRFYSDLVYEVKMSGTRAIIYFLFEHKSKEAPFVALQLLKYLVHIWELYLKQHKTAKKLPLILPILIYHGAQSWQVDTQFISLFDLSKEVMEPVRRYIPDFNYNLFDISHMSDEEIRGEIKLKVFLLTLKYILTPELLHQLPGILQLLKELEEKEHGTEYLEVVLRYISRKLPEVKTQKFMDSVSQILNEGGDIMMTIAQRWEANGKKEGKKEGKMETTHEIIKNAFKLGLPLPTIEKLTGLSADKISHIKERMASSQKENRE